MIVVAGENVVDLVPEPAEGAARYRATLGGGPANIAVALARLGRPVAMAARLGADAFGAQLAARLEAAGVRTDHLVWSRQSSTLAVVSLDGGGSARYDFWLTGAADYGWTAGELPAPDAGIDAIVLGSLAAFLPPGADALRDWAAAARRTGVVALDPNLRPEALRAVLPGATTPDGLPEAALRRLDELVGVADVVKASDEDLAAAAPGRDPERVAAEWLARPDGPALVVLTRGGDGAVGLTRSVRVAVPAPAVTVVDTIGAGDTAMGALLSELDGRGLLGPTGRKALAALDEETLTGLLRTVCTAAALACTRPGADPPTAEELAAATF